MLVACRCIRKTLVEVQNLSFAFFGNRVADELWRDDAGLVSLVGADGPRISGVVDFESHDFVFEVDFRNRSFIFCLFLGGHELGLDLLKHAELAVVGEVAKLFDVGLDEVFFRVAGLGFGGFGVRWQSIGGELS